MTCFFRYSVLLAAFVTGLVSVSAQMIYTTEIGVYAGASYFTGDADKKMLAGMQEDMGLTMRYVFNQRIALHADYHRMKIGGTYTGNYPLIYPEEVQIDNRADLIDLTMAFNFFDYGFLEHVMYSSNVTPYLFAGIGGIYYPLANRDKMSLSFPFGIGMKMRLTSRLHLNIQWTHRLLSGSDRIEGREEMNNPLFLNGTNRLNNDGAGSLNIGLSIGITQRNCKCQNYQ